VGGQTAGKLREAAARKRAAIEETMEYKEIWTCEIEEMLEKSKRKQRKLDREEAKRRSLEEEEELMEPMAERIPVEEPEISPDNLMPAADDESILMEAESIVMEEPEELDESFWSEDEFSEMGEAPEESIDPGMAKFFDHCKVDGPIKISDAFFGGRTVKDLLKNRLKIISNRDQNICFPQLWGILKK
jgi:hypothetical protein